MRSRVDAPRLIGRISVPGDKSISHRAAIVAAIAQGRSVIEGFSAAGDCASTIAVLRRLGVGISTDPRRRLVVEGQGFDGLAAPGWPLDCGRSGTTMRLLAGVLAARPFRSTLVGDEQLMRRPMERVAEPLRPMGAEVATRDGRPPVSIVGGLLRGIEYPLPVASAQVKSAVLLAGLGAAGRTTVVEELPSRDHTERLLAAAGVPVSRQVAAVGCVRVAVQQVEVPPFGLRVPGDISSAAPLAAAAVIVPGSDVVVEGVGLNPTRTGFLEALRAMGADVEFEASSVAGEEPIGCLRVRHTPSLGPVAVGPRDVPSLIDELPLLAVVATQAEGTSEIRGAAELRVKESDRIHVLATGLRALGADVEELPDGLVVCGPSPLRGGTVDAAGDHRLAMAFRVASFVADGPVRVERAELVGDSFPGFDAALSALGGSARGAS